MSWTPGSPISKTEILSGKYPVKFYRIPDTTGRRNFTEYRTVVSADPVHPYFVFMIFSFWNKIKNRPERRYFYFLRHSTRLRYTVWKVTFTTLDGCSGQNERRAHDNLWSLNKTSLKVASYCSGKVVKRKISTWKSPMNISEKNETEAIA